MPKIDLTITISVILTLTAILSPIFTAIINNRHQLKIRKLDNEKQKYENSTLYKRNIFENYLRHSGRCISRASSDSMRDYGEYYLVALMYAPEDIRQKMIRMDALMRKYKWEEASALSEELAPMIRDLLQQL